MFDHRDSSGWPVGRMVVAMFLLPALIACGGTKVLKNPEPMELVRPLTVATDDRITLLLDWVIVRGGPGTWAKNADWDEYLLRIQNNHAEPISVTSIAVYDSMGTRQETVANRPALVKESKRTQKRYKGQGVKVKAGMGTGTLVAAAGATAYVGASIGAAAIYAPGALVAGAAGALVLAPVLAVGGVLRGVNNSKVNSIIESRQTGLPLQLNQQETQGFDLFFPLTPSPQKIEVTYTDGTGNHLLVADTSEVLTGLHLDRTEE